MFSGSNCLDLSRTEFQCSNQERARETRMADGLRGCQGGEASEPPFESRLLKLVLSLLSKWFLREKEAGSFWRSILNGLKSADSAVPRTGFFFRFSQQWWCMYVRCLARGEPQSDAPELNAVTWPTWGDSGKEPALNDPHSAGVSKLPCSLTSSLFGFLNYGYICCFFKEYIKTFYLLSRSKILSKLLNFDSLPIF